MSESRLIISGSPRPKGKSNLLVNCLAKRYQAESSDAASSVFCISDYSIAACAACDACKVSGECIIDDEMQALYDLLASADALTVVCPVYFAGPPAQFKAVLDRLQRFFWTDARTQPKRSCELYVIGDGGDPHGFEPLVGIVRSALAVVGFRLDTVHDCVGASAEELQQIGAFGLEQGIDVSKTVEARNVPEVVNTLDVVGELAESRATSAALENVPGFISSFGGGRS